VRLRAPAKVNLRLEVLGRRPDGYHEIRSLVTAAGLFDELKFDPAAPGFFELFCDEPALPSDQSNLVARAARLMAEQIGRDPGARIALHKSIPLGAGLGGGSSDAAATLRVLNELWEAGLPEAELARIGAEIGSDVPLFFSLPAAVLEGRGERVTRTELRWSGWLLLVLGEAAVSTAEVYRAWRPNDSRTRDAGAIQRMADAAEAETLSELCLNELQPAVFRVAPGVERMYARVQGTVGTRIFVSGAGSTLFALFDSRQEAQSAGRKLSEMGLRNTVVGAGRNALANLRA
jgi:4-diphosphocytidyl-2-C-methyl-D-erythritol kinase